MNYVNSLCDGKGLSGLGVELDEDLKRMEKMLVASTVMMI